IKKNIDALISQPAQNTEQSKIISAIKKEFFSNIKINNKEWPLYFLKGEWWNDDIFKAVKNYTVCPLKINKCKHPKTEKIPYFLFTGVINALRERKEGKEVEFNISIENDEIIIKSVLIRPSDNPSPIAGTGPSTENVAFWTNLYAKCSYFFGNPYFDKDCVKIPLKDTFYKKANPYVRPSSYTKTKEHKKETPASSNNNHFYFQLGARYQEFVYSYLISSQAKYPAEREKLNDVLKTSNERFINIVHSIGLPDPEFPDRERVMSYGQDLFVKSPGQVREKTLFELGIASFNLALVLSAKGLEGDYKASNQASDAFFSKLSVADVDKKIGENYVTELLHCETAEDKNATYERFIVSTTNLLK
ncbi:MAG: hypothetical protein HQM12_23915, partial [SAR324 cluster bacterium]|nr:hypothetical protein [SAR324 cluster bacterium]